MCFVSRHPSQILSKASCADLLQYHMVTHRGAANRQSLTTIAELGHARAHEICKNLFHENGRRYCEMDLAREKCNYIYKSLHIVPTIPFVHWLSKSHHQRSWQHNWITVSCDCTCIYAGLSPHRFRNFIESVNPNSNHNTWIGFHLDWMDLGWPELISLQCLQMR